MAIFSQSSLSLLLAVTGCILAVTHAGTYENDGLIIETSERRLATVEYGGSCLTISCSYAATRNSGETVYALLLRQYNEDSAAFNIEVEGISTENPDSTSTLPEYNTTEISISGSEASLKVDVFGQTVCQFARYQCIVEFESGNAILVEEEDELPFTEVESDEEWLVIVTQYIVDRMTDMKTKLDGHVINLESRLDQVHTDFSGEVTQLNQDLEEQKTSVNAKVDTEAQSVSDGISRLEADTLTQIDTIKSGLSSSISALQTNVDNKIATQESDLTLAIGDTATQLLRNIGSIRRATSDRMDTAESELAAKIASLETGVATISSETSLSIEALTTTLTEELVSLDEGVDVSINEVVDSNQAGADRLLASSAENQEAATTALTDGVAGVQESVTAVRNLVESGIASLESEGSTQAATLTEQVSSEIAGLENDVSSSVNTLARSVGIQASNLDASILNAASALTTDLNTLESSNTAKVDQLQTDVTASVESLSAQVSASLLDTGSTVGARISDLDAAVVQVSQNLLAQLISVRDSTSSSLAQLGALTAAGFSQLQSNVQNKLSSLENETIENVQQLSNQLDDNLVIEAAVNEKLSGLQTNIEARITQVSELLANLLATTTGDQSQTLSTMDQDFTTRFNELQTNVQDVNAKTAQSITDASSEISSQVQETQNQFTGAINAASTTNAERITTADQAATTSISTSQGNLEQEVSDAETQGATSISAISTDVEARADGVSTTNGVTSSSLSVLAADSSQIQTDTVTLDQNLDATSATYSQLSDQLTSIDSDISNLAAATQESFQGLSQSLTTISEGYNTEINTITNGLDVLEAARAEGQDQSETELVSINSYLVDTSTSLYNELNINFNALDQMLEETTETLTSYLSPTECVKGMGFLASSSLEYLVMPPSDTVDFEFLCDAHTDSGGWILIQKRDTGDTDFYQNWDAYKNGFGALTEDFWIGLERIHQLTSQAEYVLRVDMVYQGSSKYAQYDTFSLGDEASNYQMILSDYSGTAGDSMFDTNGMGFSTYDRDHDNNQYESCAVENVGGWWYNNCQYANLNGVWGQKDSQGPRWNTFTGDQPVVLSEIKIRLKDEPAKKK